MPGMSLIHNERTKLTATFLNNVAVALFAVGALAPLVAGVRPLAGIAVQAVVCLLAAAALHWIARSILRRLRDD